MFQIAIPYPLLSELPGRPHLSPWRPSFVFYVIVFIEL
jgi:hypothetical protein